MSYSYHQCTIVCNDVELFVCELHELYVFCVINLTSDNWRFDVIGDDIEHTVPGFL